MKDKHAAKTKLYDECLYCAYHLPLLPGSGTDGLRVKSSPILKNPGGRAVLDVQMERNEARDYHEDYFRGRRKHRMASMGSDDMSGEEGIYGGSPGNDPLSPKEGRDGRRDSEGNGNGHSRTAFSPEPPDAPDASSFAELYIFSYGVVVFWNFTERQEKVRLRSYVFGMGNDDANIMGYRISLPT